MIRTRPWWGAAVAAAVAWCAAPAVAASNVPATGVLPGGVSYTIVADSAQPVATIALWYRAPDDGFGTTPNVGLARLAADTVAASHPITGTPLTQLVAREGGRLSVAAYPDSVAVTALVPPGRAAEIVRAMTADYFAPVIDATGLDIAKRQVAEDVAYASFDPEETLEDALGATLFAAGPFRDGTLGTQQQIRDTSLTAVQGFAQRAFRPGNAILVLTGNVDGSALGGVARQQSPAAAPSEGPAASPALPAPATVQREGNASGIGLGWIGPPIASEADATALDFVADAYFAPNTGIVAKALGDSRVDVTGKFVTYHDPGVFLVTISGDGADAARAVVTRVLAGAATPMDPKTFAAARAAFVYDVLSTSSSPPDASDTFGWYAVEGDPRYAPTAGPGRGRYLDLVASLTPTSVAQAVRRYLAGPPGVVTLVKTGHSSQGSGT